MDNPFLVIDPREQALHREIEAEQVRKVDLDEYQPGSERLERLYVAMETAQRFTFPSTMEFNV
jgi:hypothetical protein